MVSSFATELVRSMRAWQRARDSLTGSLVSLEEASDVWKSSEIGTRNARATPVAELILGLNPDLEGDTTALWIAREAGERGIRSTRLARGLPSGSQLELANPAVLGDVVRDLESKAQRNSDMNGRPATGPGRPNVW